jgi:hypothetical protein
LWLAFAGWLLLLNAQLWGTLLRFLDHGDLEAGRWAMLALYVVLAVTTWRGSRLGRWGSLLLAALWLVGAGVLVVGVGAVGSFFEQGVQGLGHLLVVIGLLTRRSREHFARG